MNRLSSTYCPSSSDITSCGVLSRFSSTGKERDEETGYGYFGARYMDHELMTMWLSVDPMADKYPSISPYAYCAWNPVRLVDPDGNEIGDYYSESGKYLGSDGIEDGKIYVAFGNDKEIQEKIKNGDYSFDKQYLLNRDALGEMYDYAVESNNGNNRREYGGSIYQDADGNQHVYFCKPGPEYSSGDHFSSVGKHDWIEDYDFDGLTLVTDFHTHHRYLYQTPSETDRNNVLNASGERYGGATCPYNIELAMGSKQLYFYDSKRSDVVKWSFATVERILRRK